jgi:NADH-quinone oxidoreductase subunit F
VEGAGAFVCGEETALIASLEGYAGRPRPRPPFPAQKGLYGKPTNINNVETWYNVAPIVSKGPAWFSETGSTKSAGTKVFSLVGKINNTGLVEMPLGTPLKTFIYDVGEGGSDGKHIKAVQTGGPSGGCIPQEMFDTPVDYETLAQLGSIMGSGGMVVMDEDNCMVDVARYFIEFTHSESCGKCIPCRVGLDKSLRILNAFTRGRPPKPTWTAGRDGPHDPRHLAVRPGADGAQPAADHHAALPPRVRGPHPRQTLPRGRVRGPGALAVREQLPAAHEHPALPAAL